MTKTDLVAPDILSSQIEQIRAAGITAPLATLSNATGAGLDELKQRGLKFVEPGEGMSEPELEALRDRAAVDLVSSDYIPSPVYNKTLLLLEQYRSGRAGASAPQE